MQLPKAFKALIGVLAAIVAAFIVLAIVNTVESPTIAPEEQGRHEVTYEGREGVDALTLLKERHEVRTQSFGSAGEFVTSIDGITPLGDEFWAFYVNGESAQVGAGSYITHDNDIITWRIEKIQN